MGKSIELSLCCKDPLKKFQPYEIVWILKGFQINKQDIRLAKQGNPIGKLRISQKMSNIKYFAIQE